MEVPTQSVPVSPPPMTMTSLPSAEMGAPFLAAIEQALGVGLEKFHGEMNALEAAAFDGQIARLGGAGAEDDGIKLAQEIFGGIILADFGVGEKVDAFRRHLVDAALDEFFVQLHVGNAIHEQAAKTVGAFENGDEMPGAIELGGGAEAGRAGADDGDFFAGARAGGSAA